ncbi:MAG: hypothetical protein Q8L06_11090 [Pseudohongiella sp.]|nr:hypothetical protein [Pseudohongiella sp.]
MIEEQAFYIIPWDSPIIAAVMTINIRYRAYLQSAVWKQGLCGRQQMKKCRVLLSVDDSIQTETRRG